MKTDYAKMKSFMAKHAASSPTLKDLKDEGDAFYLKKKQEEAKLLEAYNQKKLKSKKDIRRAKVLAQKLASSVKEDN